jgi:ADP-glucose pyrophosphorylase
MSIIEFCNLLCDLADNNLIEMHNDDNDNINFKLKTIDDLDMTVFDDGTLNTDEDGNIIDFNMPLVIEGFQTGNYAINDIAYYMKKLRDAHLITIENDSIHLTDLGRKFETLLWSMRSLSSEFIEYDLEKINKEWKLRIK